MAAPAVARMDEPRHPPPGWYAAPDDPGRERYWDGQAWTAQMRETGAPEPGGPGWRAWLGSGGRPPWPPWTDRDAVRRYGIPALAGLLGILLGLALATGEERERTTTETTTLVSHRTDTKTVTRTVRRRVRPRRITVTETTTVQASGGGGGGADDGDGGGGGDGCDPNYTGACVPPSSQGDVDCADVGTPVRVVGSDPHDLDRDGDGSACE